MNIFNLAHSFSIRQQVWSRVAEDNKGKRILPLTRVHSQSPVTCLHAKIDLLFLLFNYCKLLFDMFTHNTRDVMTTGFRTRPLRLLHTWKRSLRDIGSRPLPLLSSPAFDLKKRFIRHLLDQMITDGSNSFKHICLLAPCRDKVYVEQIKV